MRSRRLTLVALLVVIGSLSAPLEAQTQVGSASTEADPAIARPSRVRFDAPRGGSLLVHGTYPRYESSCVAPRQPLLHARYRGTVELGRASDGSLFLIGVLAFEDYLKGIAEVPRHWPMEALKAQVVAARSYAMVRLARGSDEGRALGYDLCATDACQVYLGMGIEAGPWGERWVQAVEDTEGQVLRYRDSPAETLYFSTSNGRTYGNGRVFGGSPLPYLRGIRERDDGESPLSRWRVTVPFDDLSRFLERAGQWPGGRIRRAEDDGERIVLGGARRAVLQRDELRNALNAWAWCLEPDAYPSQEPDGYRLPQTVPSIWYRARQAGRALVLEGRGWGHGVGMVQWGAKGKADRGLGYGDILAAYYGGLRPENVDVPGRIRVLIADGLRSVTVAPAGDAEVRWRRRVPDPPWTVTGGSRLRVAHGSRPAPLLEAEGLRTPSRTRAGGRVRLALTLSRSARVRLEFLRQGEVVDVTDWQPVLAGEGTAVRLEVPTVEPGRYRVRAAATDGVDRVMTGDALVQVLRGRAATSPSPQPPPDTASPSPVVPQEPTTALSRWTSAAALLAALLILAAVLLLTLERRKRLHRGPWSE